MRYPVRWSIQSVLNFTPWQTCSLRHQVGFFGKHSARLQLLHKDYSLTYFCHCLYSQVLVYTAERTGCHEENENIQASKHQQRKESNPRSLTTLLIYRCFCVFHHLNGEVWLFEVKRLLHQLLPLLFIPRSTNMRNVLILDMDKILMPNRDTTVMEIF